jgi:hypothetical protein
VRAIQSSETRDQCAEWEGQAVFESPQHMAVAGHGTTILPPTPRPTGRLGSSICRFSVRHDKAYNQPYINSNNEPNGDANDCWNNVSNNCCNNQPDSDRFRLRYRPLFSRRYACRRKRVHGSRYVCRYFPTSFDGYFARQNRGLIARRIRSPPVPRDELQYGIKSEDSAAWLRPAPAEEHVGRGRDDPRNAQRVRQVERVAAPVADAVALFTPPHGTKPRARLSRLAPS